MQPICREMMKGYFFDMDGTLIDSMPNHSKAWEKVMAQYGIRFAPRDCYINEGRTSRDVIRLLADRQGVAIADDQLDEIYQAKTNAYRSLGERVPVVGVGDVLTNLARNPENQIWVVTGGGQVDLWEQLEDLFPGIFRREWMITAFDVTHGKPSAEPYLKAWEKSGLTKEECCVIENAPLGIRSGKAAGLFTIGVNTGILTPDDLSEAGADIVFNSMYELNKWLMNRLKTKK